MSNQNELIAQFIEISGGEESVARFYLSNSNWSLEEALSNFLGHQSENESGVNPVNIPPQSDFPGPSTQNFTNENFQKQPVTKPKFATLKDMDNRDPTEEEGQAFYAGGSERSGQQVLGPPKQKNFREQLTNMIRNAHELSTLETNAAPSTSNQTNWGQGVRLGMTNNDHTVISPQGNGSSGERKPLVMLKLWSQGFSIDDGELRLYEDPENKEFLETVMRGEIPQEFLQMGWMVNVDIEDHRHEEYKKVATVKTFKGSGHTLGSPVPNIEESSTSLTTSATTSTKSANNEKVAKEKLGLQSDQPVTTLQIRLSDGSRLTAHFNLTHTVADIHQYIQNARPQYAEGNFILVSSFPTRELKDTTVTIESAGLKNASLLQRMI